MNRPVAARAIFLASILVGLSVGAVVFAALVASAPVAIGIALGSGIALLVGLSWILGALLTFDGPMTRLLKATLGLGPVRFVFALGAVCGVGVLAHDSVDMVALGCSFAAAHMLLLLIEADIFMRLTDSSSRYPPARPIKFGGVRLW